MEVTKKSRDGTAKKRDKSSKSKKASSKGTKKGKASSKSQSLSASRPLTEFEMGELFRRYTSGGSDDDKNNSGDAAASSSNNNNSHQPAAEVLTRDQLKRMLDDLKLTGPAIAQALDRRAEESSSLTPRTKFDLGMLFAQHDPKGTGVIDRQATQAILNQLSSRQQRNNNSGSPAGPLPYPQANHVYSHLPSGAMHWSTSAQHTGGALLAQPNHLGAQNLPPYVPNGTRPMPPYVPKHLANHNQHNYNTVDPTKIPSSSLDSAFDYYSIEQQQQQQQQQPPGTTTPFGPYSGYAAPAYVRDSGGEQNNTAFHAGAMYSNPMPGARQQQPSHNRATDNHDDFASGATRRNNDAHPPQWEGGNARHHSSSNSNNTNNNEMRAHSRSHTHDNPEDTTIRRDYLNFRSQVDAALCPRKRQEVRALNEIVEAERAAREQATEYKSKLDMFVQRMQSRIDKHLRSQQARLGEAKSQHARALETMYRFEELAYGSSPRDAVEMHLNSLGGGGTVGVARAQSMSEPGSRASAAPEAGGAGGREDLNENIIGDDDHADASTLVPPALPAADALETATLVEFVRCFPDLRAAAQRLANAPIGHEAHRPQEQLQATRQVLRAVRNEPWPAVDVDELEMRAKSHDELLAQVREKDQVIGALLEERDALVQSAQQQQQQQQQRNSSQGDVVRKGDEEEKERAARRAFDEEKQDTLRKVQALADASTAEVQSWMELTEKITEDMGAQIAELQEECRVLAHHNAQLRRGRGQEEEEEADRRYIGHDARLSERAADAGSSCSNNSSGSGNRGPYKLVTIRPEVG